MHFCVHSTLLSWHDFFEFLPSGAHYTLLFIVFDRSTGLTHLHHMKRVQAYRMLLFGLIVGQPSPCMLNTPNLILAKWKHKKNVSSTKGAQKRYVSLDIGKICVSAGWADLSCLHIFLYIKSYLIPMSTGGMPEFGCMNTRGAKGGS